MFPADVFLLWLAASDTTTHDTVILALIAPIATIAAAMAFVIKSLSTNRDRIDKVVDILEERLAKVSEDRDHWRDEAEHNQAIIQQLLDGGLVSDVEPSGGAHGRSR